MASKPKIHKTKEGVPYADGFDFPVGPRDEGADVFKTHVLTTTLADPEYFDIFKVWHTGEDWNGKGGGDSDLGQPIYAIAHGRVLEFGNYTPSWGNIVLLEHAHPDGTMLWSQYAHLDEIWVKKKGDILRRGDQLGTLGKGAKTSKFPNGRWWAHLHFEIRKQPLRIDMWRPIVASRQDVLAHYVNPRQFIEASRPKGFVKFKPPRGRPKQEPKPDPQPAPEPDKIPEMLPAETYGRWPGDPAGFAVNEYEASPDRPIHEDLDVYGKPFRYKLTSRTHDVTMGYHIHLPTAGRYVIEAFIPAQYASERRAQYFVTHYVNGLQTVRRVEVDQKAHWNKWVSLGEYDLDPLLPSDGLVNVADQSHETPPQLIAFSGMRWRKVGD